MPSSYSAKTYNSWHTPQRLRSMVCVYRIQCMYFVWVCGEYARQYNVRSVTYAAGPQSYAAYKGKAYVRIENCSSSVADFAEVVRQPYTTPVEPYSRSDKSTRPARSRRHVLMPYTHVHIKMLNINAARVSFKFLYGPHWNSSKITSLYIIYEPVVTLLKYFSFCYIAGCCRRSVCSIA